MTTEAEPEVHIHRCFTCTDLYTCRCSRNVRELLCIPCMEYTRQDGKNRVILIVRPKLDETIAYAAGREQNAAKGEDLHGTIYWAGYQKALQDLQIDQMKSKIKAAAILERGRIWTGRRHHEIIWEIVAARGEDQGPVLGEQGFVTEDGRFVSREEAAQLAFDEGQITERKKTLFSEDIL